MLRPSLMMILMLPLHAVGCASSTVDATSFEFADSPTHVDNPVPAPLYLLLNPAEFADSWPIRHNRVATHTLDGLHSFFRDALRARVAPFFGEVVVVTTDAELPTTPHWVARFSARGVDLNSRANQAGTHTWQGLATWGVALRHSVAEAHQIGYSSAVVGQVVATTASGALSDEQRFDMVQSVLTTMLAQQSQLLSRHLRALRGECGMLGGYGQKVGPRCQ